MLKPTLTKQDIDKIRQMDNGGQGDRAGAYVLLWQLTGSGEALKQARVSSFSGGDGGAAFGANFELQKKMGNEYPGIFQLSQQVFDSSINNVEANLKRINEGQAIDPILFRGAEDAWSKARTTNGETVFLKHDFPGNIFAFNPDSSNRFDGLQFSHGSLVALEGTRDAVLFGKSQSDFNGLAGFSTHVVTSYTGQSLITIKDDRTGKTVFVGTGGDWEQEATDFGLIRERHLVNHETVEERQKLQILRQNEEPEFVSIDKYGNVRLTALATDLAGKSAVEALRYFAAKAHVNAAQKPLSVPMQIHQMVKHLRQSRRSYAPVYAAAKKISSLKTRGAGALPESAIAPPSWQGLLGALLQARRREGMSPVVALQAAPAIGSSAADGDLTPWIARSPACRSMMAGIPDHAMSIQALRRIAGGGMTTALAKTHAAMAASASGRRSRAQPDGGKESLSPRAGAGVRGIYKLAFRSGSGLPSMAPSMARHAQGGVKSMPRTLQNAGTLPQPGATIADTLRHAPHLRARDVAGPDFNQTRSMRQNEVSQAVRDYFERLARMPPSSGAGFDPRAAPAWAGLQMPG